MRNNYNHEDDDVVMQDVCATAEERARDELQAFFTKQTWFSAPGRHDHLAVLDILKAYPRLCMTRFSVRYPRSVNNNHYNRHNNNNNERTHRVPPLRLLVEGRADLDVIRTAYDLNPGVLAQDFDIIFILRRACEYRAPAMVVEYLGLKFPKALSDSCYKQVALVYALKDTGKGRSSLETIQVLLRLCPKSVQYVDKDRDNALNLAIMNGYDLNVVELLLDVMQQQSCDLSLLCIPRRWNFTLDVHAAQAINLVLSRRHQLTGLGPLDCRPTRWTHSGFALMMHSLANHKSSLYSVNLDLPSVDSNIPVESIHYGLERIVNCESRVQELELSAQNTTTETVCAALYGLESGLSDNNNLQKLQLQGLECLELTMLAKFLGSESAPRTVHIMSCRIHETQQPTNTSLPPIQAFHKLERLEIKSNYVDQLSLTFLLDLIARMPRIKELCLISSCELSDNSPRSDLVMPVEPLVALLGSNIIQSLDIAGYVLQAKLFYRAILTNASLRHFRYTNRKGYAPDRLYNTFEDHKKFLALALECGNCDLVDPYIGDRMTIPGSTCSAFHGGNTTTIPYGGSTSSCSNSFQQHGHAPLDAKINFFACLNRFGRATARDPTETVDTIVNLLCNVSDGGPHKCFPGFNPLRKHSIQYGLLRESLSIWSTNISHNKHLCCTDYPEYSAPPTILPQREETGGLDSMIDF